MNTKVSARGIVVQSTKNLAEPRRPLAEQLSTVAGLTVYPSKANFLFVELPDGMSGRRLRDRLLKNYGLMVRECSNKTGASEQYQRLAVQTRAAVDVLVRALREELARMTVNYSALSAA